MIAKHAPQARRFGHRLNRHLGASLLLAGGLLASPASHALSCMVVGEKTARVSSSEGENSPVFMSNACETLKLLSGKAMVSWISRDGKPHFSPITASGVAELPASGGEERSARVVWSELTSTREATRPAFMRALDEERPARIFIPADGLAFPAKPGAVLSLQRRDAPGSAAVELRQDGDTPIRLRREQLLPEAQYVVELSSSSGKERWMLRPISADESTQIQSRLDEIGSADLASDQRRLLRAMLYEQLKLPVNMQLSLSATE